VAFGGRPGEGARPSEQLAFRERAALPDVDSSRAAVALVIGADLLGKVLDHLAVTDQQQVVIGLQDMGDLGEERAHVLVAMALAGGVVLGGGRPVERCLPATVDSMRWRRATSPLQRTTEAKSAEIQTPVAWGPDIAGSSSPGRLPGISHRRPRPNGPAYQWMAPLKKSAVSVITTTTARRPPSIRAALER